MTTRRYAVLFAVLLLSLACGGNPDVTVDFPAGTPLRAILLGVTTQTPHTYVVVNDTKLLDVRSTQPLAGTFSTSQFMDLVDRACAVGHRIEKFEAGSPRLTVRIFRGSEKSAGTYALVNRGRLITGTDSR